MRTFEIVSVVWVVGAILLGGFLGLVAGWQPQEKSRRMVVIVGVALATGLLMMITPMIIASKVGASNVDTLRAEDVPGWLRGHSTSITQTMVLSNKQGAIDLADGKRVFFDSSISYKKGVRINYACGQALVPQGRTEVLKERCFELAYTVRIPAPYRSIWANWWLSMLAGVGLLVATRAGFWRGRRKSARSPGETAAG